MALQTTGEPETGGGVYLRINAGMDDWEGISSSLTLTVHSCSSLSSFTVQATFHTLF